MKKFFLSLVIIGGICGLTYYGVHHFSSGPQVNAASVSSSKKSSSSSKSKTTARTASKTIAVNECAANTLPQLVLVSISQRHLWACGGTKVLFSSAVVTGIMTLPADLTPVGTYHIYAMQTNRYLTGTDSTGSWNDYVHYWMPFLYNQYGAYGLHDATWRPANAFGNISPYSSNASHGCVELPLATAAWLYNWVHIGTTVTIES